MKKLLCLILASIMVLGLFAGCQTENPNNTVDGNFTPYEGAPNLSGRTITILTENTWVSGIDLSDILPRFKQIEERTGCTIVWETVPGGTDFNTVVQTRLANPDDCPDIIAVGTDMPVLAQYIEEELLFDVTDAYDTCPNIKAFYEEHRTDLKATFTYFDGGIYNLLANVWQNAEEQTEWTSLNGDNALWYRADIAEELGFTTYPKTIEELYQLLKAVKENYPNMVPMHMWNWSDWESVRIFNAAYGLHYNNEQSHGYFYPDENGKIQYEPALTATKEWLTEMNKWYKEGLIVIGASEDAKIGAPAQGKTFCGFYAGIYNTVQPILQQNNPDARFSYMPMPTKDGYDTTYMPRGAYGKSFIIVNNGDLSQCEAAAQFLDYAYFSDYGIASEKAGVEGEGWSFDEEGNFVPNEEFLAKLAKGEMTLQETGANIHYNGPSVYSLAVNTAWLEAEERARATAGLDPVMSESEKANWLEINAINTSFYCTPMPAMYMTQEDLDTISTIGGDIGTLTAEYLERYILGTRKLENFESEFVAKLYEMGLQQILDINQKYYDAWLENSGN